MNHPELWRDLQRLQQVNAELGATVFRGIQPIAANGVTLWSVGGTLDPDNFLDRHQAARFGAHQDAPSGIGLSKHEATSLMLCEGLERYYSACRNPDDLIFARARDLASKAINIENICNRSSISVEQSLNTPLHWTSCVSLHDLKRRLVPAQLVYLPFQHDSLLLRHPTSNGCAFAANKEEALLRALLEVLERHHFMKTFFERRSASQLVVKERSLNSLLNGLKDEQGADVALFKLTQDEPYAVVLAIWLRRGAKQTEAKLSLGMGTSTSLHQATWKAIGEVAKAYLYAQEIVGQASLARREQMRDPRNVRTVSDRALYWSQPDAFTDLAFLDSGPIEEVDGREEDKGGCGLSVVLSYLSQNSVDVFAKRLSDGKLRERGFHVYRVICPQLQPVSMSEDFVYDRGPLLDTSRCDFSIPHPFL